MKKKITIITSIVLIILGVGLIIYFSTKKEETNAPLQSTTTTSEYDKLKTILKESPYFEKSKFEYDETTNKVTIDEKYEVFIKSGYYLMNIKDTKNESTYCNVVDAVEISLGLEKGKSISTCEATLDGSINMGAINADVYDSYKVLTVNNTEVTALYNTTNSYKNDELISIDEINYNIDFSNYLFTSMSTGYTADVKLFTVCGHVFNKNNTPATFTFTTYDANKAAITSSDYVFENDTKQYATFCADFNNDAGFAKYYSIDKK